MTTLYRCDCGWEGHERDLRSVCTFKQTRLEPAEYELYCPDCDINWDDMAEVPKCASCKDQYVKEEGDNCAECTEAMREDHHDGLREERLLS